MVAFDYLKCVQQEKTAKLTPMVRFGNRTYRVYESNIWENEVHIPIIKHTLIYQIPQPSVVRSRAIPCTYYIRRRVL